MKQQKHEPQTSPISGYALAERLHLAIKVAIGEDVTFGQLAEQIGCRRSTFHRWCRDTGPEHFERILRLLELLTPEERQGFWDAHCRPRPGLGHPRLAHDAQGVNQLRALLRKSIGLTLVTGASAATTFVLTALGHESRRLDRRHRSAVGLSVHPPDSHVPVPGVHYLRALLSRPEQLDEVRRRWTGMIACGAQVVLLDTVPGLEQEILELAQQKHVVLVPATFSERRRAWPPQPLKNGHRVRVGTSTQLAGPIHVKVEAME